MAFIDWSDKYALGLEDIDPQHKKLVQYINELYDGMKAGKANEIVGKLLAGLKNYTITHFAYEEKMLLRVKYAAFPQHKAQHEAFVAKVAEFEKRFQEGGSVSVEMMNFLKDWLIKHIMGTDRLYVPSCKQMSAVK